MRRLGGWAVVPVSSPWGKDRGPDPVKEFDEFCEHLQAHLGCAAFRKPISEVLLDQRYFNGVGNYLRYVET